MGRHQREKGKRGEREVATLLREKFAWLADKVRRGASQSRRGSDAADVEGLPWWMEVKLGARPNIHAAMKQGRAMTDGRPVVVFTRRDREDWLVTVPADDWLAAMAELEERRRAGDAGD